MYILNYTLIIGAGSYIMVVLMCTVIILLCKSVPYISGMTAYTCTYNIMIRLIYKTYLSVKQSLLAVVKSQANCRDVLATPVTKLATFHKGMYTY